MAEAANGSLGGFAQEGFEVAKGRLDRVEVGRIAWQVTQRRTGCLDGFAHTGDLMSFEVVDDHDVTALEGGSQALFERLLPNCDLTLRVALCAPVAFPVGALAAV